MGTSFYRLRKPYSRRDHPHAYGDKTLCKTFPALSPGSSPRVWGQDSIIIIFDSQIRIIPTRMGTSLRYYWQMTIFWDHPHAYGDKCSTLSATVHLRRIIPTRMGTSHTQAGAFSRVRDHPHAYGDKLLVQVRPDGAKGSSPRVWGQAGNGAVRIYPKEDHPHAYGDKRR